MRLLCPPNSPGKNTGVGCHSLLQGIFPIQGLNPGLLHYRKIFSCLSHQGSPDSGSNPLENCVIFYTFTRSRLSDCPSFCAFSSCWLSLSWSSHSLCCKSIVLFHLLDKMLLSRHTSPLLLCGYQWYILYREARINAWFLPWKYLFSNGIVGVERNYLQFTKF